MKTQHNQETAEGEEDDRGMRWLDGITKFNRHELGQTPGVGEDQGGLVRSSPWGHKELDMT